YFCEFFNDLTEPITWGPDTQRQEHCNLAAYYYPAGDRLSQLTLSGDLQAITPPGGVLLGASEPGVVALSNPAGPSGTDVIFNAVDRDTLAPTQNTVHVPAWGTQQSFRVTGLKPARASMLQVTTGAGVLATPVWVKGFALSEIYYHPVNGPLGL